MSNKSYWCNDGDHKACDTKYCHCYCHLFDQGVRSVGQAIGRLSVALWQRTLAVLPVTGARKHRKEIDALKERRVNDLIIARASAKREIEAERRQLQDLIAQFVKLTPKYTHSPTAGGRFQVFATLSEDFVYEILSRQDRRALEYVAQDMSRQIEREIMTIDFAHVRAAADNDDRRRTSYPGWAGDAGEMEGWQMAHITKANVFVMADDEGHKYVLCEDHPMPPVGALEFLGSFDIPDPDVGAANIVRQPWGEAGEVAEAKAKELNTRVEYHSDFIESFLASCEE